MLLVALAKVHYTFYVSSQNVFVKFPHSELYTFQVLVAIFLHLVYNNYLTYICFIQYYTFRKRGRVSLK